MASFSLLFWSLLWGFFPSYLDGYDSRWKPYGNILIARVGVALTGFPSVLVSLAITELDGWSST